MENFSENAQIHEGDITETNSEKGVLDM